MRRSLGPAPAALVLLVVAACGSSPAPVAGPSPSPSPPVSRSASPSAAPSPAASSTPSAVRRPSPSPARSPRPPRTAPPDAFSARVLPVTAARLGASHRAGCPVRPADLRLVQLVHRTFDGGTARGELVVHEDSADAVVRVFRALHEAGFPVRRMVTVDAYGGDDARSMAADNTSAYNCRRTTGGTSWSEHAYGRAIDLNPVENPYVRGSTVQPPAGRAYLDRGDVRPGMVVAGGPVVRAFAAVGWSWGGAFRTLQDYQHFSASGR